MRNLGRVTFLGLCAVGGMAFIYTGCGSSSSSDSKINTGPVAGIASPSTGVSAARDSERFELYGGSTGCGDGKSISDQTSEIGKAADPANLAATATALANFSDPTTFRAACYGPTWTDDARGSSVNRPSGDLGIVFATASDTDTTACVACQVNALISSGPGLGNKLIKVVALGLAALKSSGTAEPAAGASVNILTLGTLPTVTGITFTEFKLERLADRDGHEMYKTSIAFTNSASKTGTIVLIHEKISTDNADHKGLLYATLPHTPSSGSGTHRGVSFIYDRLAKVYKFSFRTAANRATASTDFFTNGVVDFSKTAFGEDGHYIVAYFDENNNGGSLHHGWQAGSNDGATRTFGVNVPNAAVGSRTGTGYSGFGPAITSLTAATTPWVDKMFCDWLAGLSTGTSQTKVQKQTIKESGAKFIVDTSFINFAPVPSCDKASWTVTAADSSFLNGAKTTTANDMVAPPSTSDFMYDFTASGAEPSFTIP